MKVWLDGALLELAEARVSISDKGLLVGDGVFETLRAYQARPFALVDHLDRLERSARVMRIRCPSREVLEQAVTAVVSENSLGEARLRITITSGDGPQGLGRGAGRSLVLVTGRELEPWPEQAKAVISPWPRNERSVLAGVKSTSNAENIVKLADAREKGADEAISLNLAGNVCEGTSSNVFAVCGSRVSTPPLSAGCLAGITREYLLKLGNQVGVELVEEDLSTTELRAADEVFLTSSTRELQPCVELDGKPVGDGRSGEVTARLAKAFSAMVQRTLR